MNGGMKKSSCGSLPMLIQVVPQLAQGRNGVSDQATLLAGSLKDKFGIESTFAVLNNREKCDAQYTFIECPATRLLESCLDLTQGSGGPVLVHVSGYGYSPDGAATLLADGLERVRADGRFRVGVYFHELYASGPPWKSAFWHSRRQQRALRRLIANSGLVLTNATRHAEWIKHGARNGHGVPVEIMPVFSGAGEADELPPFERRSPAMVVFGLPGTRRLAYRRIAESGNLPRTLGIEEIYDIGPESVHPSEVNGVRVKCIGLLPAEEAGAVFSQARFGFVVHPWYFLGKSSVFASYCAQGLVPVMADPFSCDSEGLRDGVHVVSAQTAEGARKTGLEKCGHAAWNWYRSHSVCVHAARYARWISESQ